MVTGQISRKWKCTWPLEAYLELVLCHFYHILLAKATHKAHLDSRNGEIDSASWWEQIQSHCKECGYRQRIIVTMFAINLSYRILTVVGATWAIRVVFLGFPCGSAGKESTCNAGDLGSIPGLGRSPGEGKGYPLQHSGLENSMDCVVHGVAKSQTWLGNLHFHFMLGKWHLPLRTVVRIDC